MTPSAQAAGMPAWARGAVGFAGFLLLLETVPLVGLAPREHLPPLHEIAGALADELVEGEFWGAVGDTMEGWAIGLAIALCAGVALGVVIGSVDLLRRLTAPTIEFLRPIPSVALIPLAILLYGTQLESKLLLIVYAAFWQIVVQVLSGVRDVDPVARDTARSFRLGAWSRVRHVIWPTALPYVMTGFRLAAAVALILAVTAELTIGNPGLGKQILVAQSSGAEDRMYALVLVTGMIGVAINVGARTVERHLLAWHPSMRRESA